ncbi:MAG TPA: uroporphyrinogen-III synthase [Sphingomicrobium sp.]|nr:uroporphyrinogen-III synthase [Sphingomicrobium sp.]
MRRLVILRPEPGASATAAAAGRLGLETLRMPLFEIRPVPWQTPDPDSFGALLLTSANAVRSAGPRLERLAGLPVYCVGGATSAAAREAGLTVADDGNGGVDSLLARLPADLRLLHLAGAHRRAPGGAQQSIDIVTVYEAIEAPAPSNFGKIEGTVVAVHSARSGRRLAQLSEASAIDRSSIAIAAISAEAGTAAGPGWKSVGIAAQPNEQALLAIALDLCNNSG